MMSVELPPLGLMNLGLTCWWNSVLQILLHNPVVRTCIESTSIDSQSKPLHYHLQHLILTIRQRDPYETYNCHVRLLKCVLQLHPTFREAPMNDAHEVLTYVLNRLHEESSLPIPAHMMTQDNKVARAILRDFDNRLSDLLQSVVGCTSRLNSDREELLETFTTLFIEPKLIESNVYSIEDALLEKKFVYLPKTLFVSLIVNQRASCRFNTEMEVQNRTYKLHSMIFFIPSASHYVCAVSTEFVSYQPIVESSPQWMFCNDQHVQMINLSEIRNYMGSDGYPTVVSYIQQEAA